MKRIFLTSILLGFGILFTFSQDSIVTIPDTAFLNALIDEGVDTNGDGLISYGEAETVSTLIIDSRAWYGCGENNNITSLVGIEAFTNLDTLWCSCGKLETLDLTGNQKLKYLNCVQNNLKSLNISNNFLLTDLYCSDNRLTSLDASNNIELRRLNSYWNNLNDIVLPDSDNLTFIDLDGNNIANLDVSSNTGLIELRCENNKLTTLDISNNTSLTVLYCGGNEIVSLDISNNSLLTYLWLVGMPSLKEVCVWESPFPPPELDVLTNDSPNVYFTTDCLYDSIVYIPDNAFLHALIENGIDTNGDGLISYKEAEVVSYLDVDGEEVCSGDSCWFTGEISSIEGIDAFINLEVLNCIGNKLSSLDMSNNSTIERLSCDFNQLSVIDVSGCDGLYLLECSENQLTSIDLSTNISLLSLSCGSNQLLNLDLSNNTNILGPMVRYSWSVYPSELGIADMPTLHEVCVWEGFHPDSLGGFRTKDNEDGVIDTTGSPNVHFTSDCQFDSVVFIPDTAFLHALIDEGVDINGDGLISYVEAETVTSLDLSGVSYSKRGNISDMSGIETFINLEYLDCSLNELTQLDLSFNTDLYAFDGHNNPLNNLDISNNINLRQIDLSSMTSLGEVCVWESFAADTSAASERDMDVNTSGSTEICFQTDCNGLCIEGIILSVSVDTIYQLMNLEATTSADGMIYLVPVDTDMDIGAIRMACMDSLAAIMNVPLMIPLEGLENGTYWLYATDHYGNISEKMAVTVMGVGIGQSKSENLRIYPNPANNLLTIETITTDLLKVRITSINGRLMLERQMEGTSHQLDLSYFQKGVYFISIRSSDFAITRKVLKL